MRGKVLRVGGDNNKNFDFKVGFFIQGTGAAHSP